MFKPHIGDCVECPRKGVIIPVKSGLCQYCNHERKQQSKRDSGKITEQWPNGVQRNSTSSSMLRGGRGCKTNVGGTKVSNGEILGRDEEGYGSGSGIEGFIRVGKSSPMVRKPIKKKPIQYRRKRTGEAEIFEEIWSSLEEKVCFVCGRQIGDPSASNFAHILPKALNKYPLFKLNPNNIKLFCHDSYSSCHHRFDKEPRSTLKEPMWHKVFALEEELKQEYKLLKSKP